MYHHPGTDELTARARGPGRVGAPKQRATRRAWRGGTHHNNDVRCRPRGAPCHHGQRSSKYISTIHRVPATWSATEESGPPMKLQSRHASRRRRCSPGHQPAGPDSVPWVGTHHRRRHTACRERVCASYTTTAGVQAYTEIEQGAPVHGWRRIVRDEWRSGGPAHASTPAWGTVFVGGRCRGIAGQPSGWWLDAPRENR